MFLEKFFLSQIRKTRISPYYYDYFMFILRLSILTLPFLTIASILRGIPIVKTTVAHSFPVYHLSEAIMITAQRFLAVFGIQSTLTFETGFYEYGLFCLRSGPYYMVNLGFPCLGLGVMFVFVALIVSWKGNYKIKVAYILFGLLIIFFLNASRMAYLTWISRDGTDFSKSIISVYGLGDYDHHALFNLFIYVVIFMLFILWIEVFSKVKPRLCQKKK